MWAVIAFTCVLRIVVIWGSFFWQDDYIHIWTAWNAPASDLIGQNWNGHREPASFAIQWALARFAPQVWWPAAVVLCLIAVMTTVGFWLMVKRWAGVTPASAAAAILFAAWPATMMPQAWLSAGLETVPLVLMFAAGWLLASPRSWTPWAVGGLAVLAWLFHERAVYFLPVLLAIAVFFGGVRKNRTSWWVLAAVTAGALILRAVDDLPGRAGGASVPGALWSAGPGSLLRSVLGWLPYEARTPVPVNAGLWAVAVLVVWMILLLIGLSTAPRHTALVAAVVAGFLVVEVLSFVWLRGGFAGGGLAADPRFTLITGTVLLAGLASFAIAWRPVVWVAAALALVGCWSIWRMSLPEDPGRAWLASARQARGDLAPTPSPPAMLAHFFFTTQPPVYELGTTRTLLQVGAQPPAFPERTTRPVQVDASGQPGPMVFTPLVVSDGRQCGRVQVPAFDAGVRVVRVGQEYVFPPPGPIADIAIAGCVNTVEVGIPGR
mgnify:FL=1